ncbi:Conserved oligomeric Golgi complex subunit [Blyttiomyces sp. JEL0837]|nr:Conserved oligomeric Golgi complex subunit [Blyttiomyces sp. JEL0837]
MHSNSQANFETHYRDFTADSFVAAEYANLIIQAPAGKTFHRADISTALSKLSFNIDHLNKQLHDQVAIHYEDLLEQVTGLSNLEEALNRVKDGLGSLNTSFGSLTRVSIAIENTETLLYESDLTGVNVVELEIPKIEKAKKYIESEAEKHLQAGMASQNQAEIASGLQVYYNLGRMAAKLQHIIDSMLDSVTKEIQKALNVSQLTNEIKEAHASLDKTKKNMGEPVNVTAPVYAAALWTRMEQLMDILFVNTVKIYVLERVLSRKKDPISQKSYFEEASKNMDGSLVKYFWKMLAHSFERELRLATKSSSYFHQIFQVGYPKLLRFFHDFFARLSIALPNPTATQIPPQTPTNAFPALPSITEDGPAPEAGVLLRVLTSFEAAYLRESLSRLLDPVNLAFPDKPVVGTRHMPSKDDVERILRTISRELEIAKFDTHLIRAVAKNVQKSLNMYSVRSEHLVATDSTVYHPTGVATASASQLLNIEIVNCLYALADGVGNIAEEYNDNVVFTFLDDSAEGLNKLIITIVEPLMAHITRDLENTILKMHKEEFSRSPTPPQAKTPPMKNTPLSPGSESNISSYVLEVGAKLRWVHREIISRLQCGDETKEWVRIVGVRVVDLFLRHASLVRPLFSELGKLKLTSDMTQLEFALNQWTTGSGLKLEVSMGDSYKALRAFRPLLFLDLTQVTAAHHTASIPPIIVVHHLICRAYPVIPLPMTLYNWTEGQYSEWLDGHSDIEAATLLARCLDAYADEVRRRGEKEFRVEYPYIRSFLEGLLGLTS